jgi:SPP1 gp7 family putative phage head morphogenesis protein
MKLSKSKTNWAESRKQATLVGKPLSSPVSVELRYYKAISQLNKQMAKEYHREFNKLFKELGNYTADASLASQAKILLNFLSDKWFSRFTTASKKMVDKLIKQTETNATSNLEQSLKQLTGGITLKTPVMPKGMSDKVTITIAENVSLIKSIPEQFHNKIAQTVFNSISQEGNGSFDIYNKALVEINKQGINIDKRAKLIAQTETNKITSFIQTEKMKSVGIKKFRWNHSGGGAEPRELHLSYDGKIFDIDNPPIIDARTGQRGMPSTIWNCRCFATPIIEFEDGEVIE